VRDNVCVNAAGEVSAGKVVRDGTALPLDEFRRTIEINLIGAFDVMRLCAERMIADELGTDGERGVVINVWSIAALQGERGQVAYSASKAGLVGLMMPAARDLASLGIRVVTIAPGASTRAWLGRSPRSRRRGFAAVDGSGGRRRRARRNALAQEALSTGMKGDRPSG
jgi:NAD(P)-dependent dehydrogenase (short-subunit alcohol dehydrogenase family)